MGISFCADNIQECHFEIMYRAGIQDVSNNHLTCEASYLGGQGMVCCLDVVCIAVVVSGEGRAIRHGAEAPVRGVLVRYLRSMWHQKSQPHYDMLAVMSGKLMALVVFASRQKCPASPHAHAIVCRMQIARTYPASLKCLSLLEPFAHTALQCLQRSPRCGVVGVDG